MESRPCDRGAGHACPTWTRITFLRRKIIAGAINFDLAGTTKIGKYIVNHSFMIPGLVATFVAVSTGLFIAKAFF